MREPPDDIAPRKLNGWIELVLLLALLIAPAAFAVYELLSSTPANAYPGGLAADGCHNDRKNGGRHCHRGPNAGPITPPRKGGDQEAYYPNCAAGRARSGTALRHCAPRAPDMPLFLPARPRALPFAA